MSKVYIRGLILKQSAKKYLDSYPFNLPIIKEIEKIQFNNPITYIVGENGSGKSTLMEAIAIANGFNAEGGSKNMRFSTHASHSILHKHITLIKNSVSPKDGYFFRAESFYNVATRIDEIDPDLINAYGSKSLHKQSHGESFLSFMNNRLFGNGLYILDEPESALSPTSQMALLRIIKELLSNNSQLIIATHSPIVLAYPGAQIYEINDGKLDEVEYEDSMVYSLTEYFINNRRRVIEDILR